MYDVWVVDFVDCDHRVVITQLTWKQAKKARRKLNRSDKFSVAFIVPSGFWFDC